MGNKYSSNLAPVRVFLTAILRPTRVWSLEEEEEEEPKKREDILLPRPKRSP